jgi:hypothetical protein
MPKILSLRVVLCALALMTLAAVGGALAQSISLAGSWSGKYLYADGRTSVAFNLNLAEVNGSCAGRSSEPNTFGNKSSPYLYANIMCPTLAVTPGAQFTFHKQYDGTGGVSHGVDYSGIVSADGNSVAGNWVIVSANSRSTGAFSMERSH